MTHIIIGNEAINTKELERLIHRNIAHYESRIAALNMKSRMGVQMLCFYARQIQQQRIMLDWIHKNDKASFSQGEVA